MSKQIHGSHQRLFYFINCRPKICSADLGLASVSLILTRNNILYEKSSVNDDLQKKKKTHYKESHGSFGVYHHKYTLECYQHQDFQLQTDYDFITMQKL